MAQSADLSNRTMSSQFNIKHAKLCSVLVTVINRITQQKDAVDVKFYREVCERFFMRLLTFLKMIRGPNIIEKIFVQLSEFFQSEGVVAIGAF